MVVNLLYDAVIIYFLCNLIFFLKKFDFTYEVSVGFRIASNRYKVRLSNKIGRIIANLIVF